MIKCVTVFITSLTVLFFIIGCEPAGPKPAETPKIMQLKAEPAKVEPPKDRKSVV